MSATVQILCSPSSQRNSESRGVTGSQKSNFVDKYSGNPDAGTLVTIF